MYKIDSVGSVSGHFSDGDYRTGRKGTKVPAHWLNAVQGELCNFVTANGIALSKNDNGQVLKALNKKLSGYFDRGVFTGYAYGNELFTGYDIGPFAVAPGGIIDFTLVVQAVSYGGAVPDVDVDVKVGTVTAKHFAVKIGELDSTTRRFCVQNNDAVTKNYTLHLTSDLDNPYMVHAYGIYNDI